MLHTASVLTNGKVLVTGGFYMNYSSLNSAELYDSLIGTWTIINNMNNARSVHTASLLMNGQVLLAGGTGPSGTLNTSELYSWS